MASIEETRSQINSARQVVAEKKAQVADLQRQLNEQDNALPSTTSQQALRQKLSGMRGRIQRQNIERERGNIRENLEYVEGYGQSLNEYEREIDATEAQVNEYERKLSEARAEAREEASAELQSYQQEFEASNPGEKLIIDWSKLRIKGIQSDNALQSLPVDEYNKKVEQLNSNLQNTLSGEGIEKINVNLPRYERIPVKTNKITSGLFASVSAQEPNYIDERGVYRGVVKRTIEPSGVAEKLRAYGRTTTNSVGGLVAGFGSSVASTASALVHPFQTGRNLWGGLNTVVSRVGSNQNFPELGQRIANPTPYDIGYVGGEILTTKGTGALATKTANLVKLSRIERTPIRFVGTIGTDTSKYTTRLNFGGKEYLALTKLDTVNPTIPGAKGGIGKEITLVNRRTNNPSIWLSDVASYNKKLGGASILNKVDNKLISNIKTPIQDVNGFFGEGFRSVRKIATINKRKAGILDTIGESSSEQLYKNMVSMETLDNNLQRSKSAGLIKPVKGKEGFFDITATARPKMRIYKSGRISYGAPISDFNIVGRVKVGNVKPQASSGAFMQSIMQNVPVSELSQGVRAMAKADVDSSAFGKLLGLSTQTVKTTAKTPSYVTPKTAKTTIQKENNDLLSGFSQATGLSQQSNQRSLSAVKQKKIQTPKQSNLNIMGDMTRQTQGSLDIFGLKNLLKSKQAMNQKQVTNNANMFRMDFAKPYVNVKFRPSVSYRAKGGRILHAAPGRYLVIVKRYGQDQVIAEASTLQEAKRILSNNLTGTLAASGFVRQSGSKKKEDVSDLFGSMFTRAKRDPFRLVQRRGKRLSSRPEVTEILGFGRRRPKQTKFNWLGSPGSKRKKSKRDFDWFD